MEESNSYSNKLRSSSHRSLRASNNLPNIVEEKESEFNSCNSSDNENAQNTGNENSRNHSHRSKKRENNSSSSNSKRSILKSGKDVQETKTETFIFSIFEKFIKDFIKVLSFRTVYTLFKTFLKKKFIFKNLFYYIFNVDNIRTSLFVSLVPFFYKIFLKIFGDNSRGTFLSGFLSGFISFYFEQKTSLVKYIILSILIRTLHAFLLAITKDNEEVFQSRYISNEFLFFLFAAYMTVYISFRFPQYTDISKVIDVYGNFTKTEMHEMNHYRMIAKLV